MEAKPQCPLEPFFMDTVEIEMNLARVLEIETHVSSGTCFHPPLKDIVMHGAYDGSTPLLFACEEGDLLAVQHIVDVWGVNVRDAAYYYHFDGEKIQEATPLFVAAINGHIEVVRYLISKNADVSVVTSTEGKLRYRGLTPLHAALMDVYPGQSFSEKCAESNVIVRLLLDAGANPSTLAKDGIPLWDRPFCGADATIALVNHGVKVKEKMVSGPTMLHHWILVSPSACNRGISDEERLRIVQSLLLDQGTDLMAQDNEGFTSILLSVQLDLYGIFELLLERNEIDRHEKVAALELAGARLLLYSRPEEAFHYWRKALLLRNEEGHDPIVKIPLQTTSGQVVEWVTSEELEKVKEDRSIHWIQAMLTQLRIYAARSWNAVELLILSRFTPFFYLSGDDYFGAEEDPTTTQKIDLMLEFLGVFISFEPHYTEKPELWMQTEKLTKEILYMLPWLPFYKDYEDQCERIETSLQLILKVDPDGRLKFRPDYGFYAMLASIPDLFLPKDVRNYFCDSARQDAGLLLASACGKEDWETLRLLLHLGIDPNTSGNGGNGPLHLVADREEHPMVLRGELEREQVSMEMEYTPAHLLFDYGANPYRINNDGKTAVDIWMAKNCGGEGMLSRAWMYRPYWCRETIPKLSCLAAKTVRSNGIPFSDENAPPKLPSTFYPFLENH